MNVLVELEQQIAEKEQHFNEKIDSFEENLGIKPKVITSKSQESIYATDNPIHNDQDTMMGLSNCNKISSLESIDISEMIQRDEQGVMVPRKCYSRDEMECISCLNVEKEKILPDEIYLKMGTSLVNECEEISGSSKPRKQSGRGKKSDCITNKEENGSVDEQGVILLKKCYSRDELESISCLNVEQEKILWDEIYLKMGTSVVKEYEEFASSSKPRKQGGRGKKLDHIMNKEENKKKKNASLRGEVFNLPMEHNLQENILCEDFGGSAYDAIMDSDIVENECNKVIESDSEDEFHNIQRPAFVVEGDPDFDSGPPQDGLEFLRRVRWEAARIPKVKVAKIDKSTLTSEQTIYMPIIPDIAKCPEHLLPSKDWQEAFLADFSELRQSLTRLDTLSENSNYPKKQININNEYLGICSADEPKLSTIIGMDVVSRASLLRSRIKSFEDKETLGRDECLWLYSLSAAIDTPFDADMGASLRCLLRKCAKLRSQKTEFDDEVVMLNILVTVSGKYFGQSES